MNSTSTDVLIIGAGIAGLTAALSASARGATVTVLEKAPVAGGSAALSAGMYWTAPSFEAFRRRIPLGDAVLGRRVVDDYYPTLDLIRSTGVRVSDEATHGVMTYGIGYSFDVRAYLAAAAELVAKRGGELITGARVRHLLGDLDRVHGAVVRLSDGSVAEYEAGAVVLATGGFQGDRELLSRYLGPNSDRLKLRSNPGSVGDGLRLAHEAGAGGTASMGSFYGHLLPEPLARFEPEDYLPLAQYYSGETMLANVRGHRFIDETLGDEIINQDLVKQPEARAVMIFDDVVRRTEAVKEPFPGTGAIDRLGHAIEAGGRYATAPTIPELLEIVSGWGVDTVALAATIDVYTAAQELGALVADGVPVSPTARMIAEGPFHALSVQPSITFTFGGIRIDDTAQVLTVDGIAVPGLYAAGADIGGLSNYGYAGGLAPAAITGRWAGEAAAALAANLTGAAR